jgi:molybdopterin converting factor subunit 1
MSVRILYFAWLRERIGRGEETLDLPASVATVGALIDHLSGLDRAHAAGFEHRKAIRCAVNQAIAADDAPVAAGDEIAFFPPVTGG